MDTELIDGRGNLRTTHFNKFRKKIGNKICICVNDNISECEVSLFRDQFSKHLINCSDDDEIFFFDDNVCLICTGKDYEKWCKPSWSECIFKEKTKTASYKDTDDFIKISIAFKDDLESAQTFTSQGINKHMLEQINECCKLMQLRSFFNRKIVMSINNGEWKEIEELKKEGILK